MNQVSETDQDKERIKCFARYCWKHRREFCPKKEQIGRKFDYPTWEQVFLFRTGISLNDYASQNAKQRGST